MRRDYDFYGENASFSLLTDRTKSDPWGLFGGRSAAPSEFVLNPESENERPLGSKSTTDLDSEDVVSLRTPGGGGYGEPTEREPERVVEDIRDGKVSPAAAAEEYGVVLDDGDLDAEATDECRASLREEGSKGGEHR